MVVLTAAQKNNGFEARIFREMHERVIKSFMDVIIMTELRKGPLSGYDVISYINAKFKLLVSKFNLLVSSGTVYSLLYSLERNGQVEGVWKERKRTYKLTDKGEETISTILNAQEKIKAFLSDIFKPQPT
jgi:DNA-binding PadR family transcriptional regulator